MVCASKAPTPLSADRRGVRGLCSHLGGHRPQSAEERGRRYRMTLNPESNEVRGSNDVRRSKTEPRLRGTDLVRPSLRDWAYLDCQRRAELIAEHAAKLPPEIHRLLDVGGRGKPYACFFADRVAHHYVLDIEPAPSVDVVGDARRMPFSDASMDVVLITQVLEHIPEPVAVIGEIRRVLKPGGTLLLTVPSIFPQHAPNFADHRNRFRNVLENLSDQ